MRAERKPTTTEQGYGAPHQRIVKQLRRDHIDGTPCDRCWRPMYRSQALDAAHPHDRPVGIYPDSKADHLEHRKCNRAGLLLPEPETSTSREW